MVHGDVKCDTVVGDGIGRQQDILSGRSCVHCSSNGTRRRHVAEWNLPIDSDGGMNEAAELHVVSIVSKC